MVLFNGCLCWIWLFSVCWVWGLVVLADLCVVVDLLIPVNSVVYLLLMWYVFIDGWRACLRIWFASLLLFVELVGLVI